MKILLASNHAMFRDGLRHILRQLEDDPTILEAQGCAAALEVIGEHPGTALALLDLECDLAGILAVAELKERHPAVATVVLSESAEPASIARAFEIGARGYVPKTASSRVLLAAVALVLAGGRYIPPEFIAGRRAEAERSGRAERRATLEAISTASCFTARQREVLALLAQGKPNKVIGRELELAPSTVKAHVTAILRTLNVANRTQAAVATAARREVGPSLAGRPPATGRTWAGARLPA